MTRDTALRVGRTESLRLGERLRQLRVAAGMTQSDLAGDRFSKEYVSQIERGKTRPTAETLEWLAARLGADAGFLANGVATDERGRIEASLARAETLIEAHKNEEAAAEFERLVPDDRRRVLPGFARRRSRGPLGARADVCREVAGGVRGDRRPRARGRADEQPRRAQLPARQDRLGGGAPEGGVRDRARDRARRRRRSRRLFARAGPPAERRRRAGRGAGAACAAAARWPRGLPRRDRQCPARPRTGAARAGPARRGRRD